MATNWWGNMSYNGGSAPTPQQNLQNARGIADKVRSGSSYRAGANGQWQEYDMWGNPVGQAPAQQNQAQNSGAPQDPNKTADPTVQEPPQKKYGGVTGGYGSGDPAEVVPPEKKEEVAGSGVTPDGGPAKPPFEPITIAAGSNTTAGGPMGSRKGSIANKFAGMQLTQEMLAGVPDTDIAKIREAAAKGPGAFKEFMKMSASAPWYKSVSEAIQKQLQASGGGRKLGNGPARMQGGPGEQRNMQDYAPAWMQKRRAENEAKRNPPMSTMPLDPNNPYGDEWKRTAPPPDYGGMQFIDRNQDGVDDRTQKGNGGEGNIKTGPNGEALMRGPDGQWGSYSQTGTVGSQPVFHPYGGPQQDPYGIPPGSQWDTPENRRLMEIRKQQEAGGMMTGWYPPWLVDQQQGGPQQNPPFDPRILQMLMGGR